MKSKEEILIYEIDCDGYNREGAYYHKEAVLEAMDIYASQQTEALRKEVEELRKVADKLTGLSEAMTHLSTTSRITNKPFLIRYNPKIDRYIVHFMDHEFNGLKEDGLYDAIVKTIELAAKVTDNFENIQ